MLIQRLPSIFSRVVFQNERKSQSLFHHRSKLWVSSARTLIQITFNYHLRKREEWGWWAKFSWWLLEKNATHWHISQLKTQHNTIECGKKKAKWVSHIREQFVENITCCNKCKVSNKVSAVDGGNRKETEKMNDMMASNKTFHENKHFYRSLSNLTKSHSTFKYISSQTNLKGQFCFMEIASHCWEKDSRKLPSLKLIVTKLSIKMLISANLSLKYFESSFSMLSLKYSWSNYVRKIFFETILTYQIVRSWEKSWKKVVQSHNFVLHTSHLRRVVWWFFDTYSETFCRCASSSPQSLSSSSLQPQFTYGKT